jgi:hypothetical protein
MRDQAESNRQVIGNVYSQIRELLQEREMALKKMISDNFEKEEEICLDKRDHVSGAIE